MSDTIFVKPAVGRVVFLEGQRDRLEDDGRDVQRSSYWIRREQDGDVVLADPPKPTKSPRANGA